MRIGLCTVLKIHTTSLSNSHFLVYSIWSLYKVSSKPRNPRKRETTPLHYITVNWNKISWNAWTTLPTPLQHTDNNFSLESRLSKVGSQIACIAGSESRKYMHTDSKCNRDRLVDGMERVTEPRKNLKIFWRASRLLALTAAPELQQKCVYADGAYWKHKSHHTIHIISSQ